ncbi:MAG TPA: putative toxin-antitoxin system toxin component, PIN family [Solirubrobacterales bacterium]
MRRVVLDPSVLVSALINPSGAPGLLLRDIRGGAMELVVSPILLEELEGVLGRDRFRRYFDLAVVRRYVDLLHRDAAVAPDPEDPPPLRSTDPDDDYLIALAHSQRAILVSGDKHLLDIGGGAPILAPADLMVSTR